MKDIKQILLKNKSEYVFINFDDFKNEDDLMNFTALKLKEGKNFIIYNCSLKSPSKTLKTALKIRQLCSIYEAVFIVSSRLDIAQIAHADGYHMTEDDIDLRYIKKYFDKDKIIGKYAHKKGDILQSFKDGIDYVIDETGEKRLILKSDGA